MGRRRWCTIRGRRGRRVTYGWRRSCRGGVWQRRGGVGRRGKGSGDGGEKEVPHFVRNDKGLLERRADSEETDASRTAVSNPMDASRTGVSDPHESSLSPFEEVAPGEVIEIQAVADDRIIGNKVAHLPLQLIEKNPYQPRRVFEESALEELRDSIKEHGVVQPVVVRPGGGGRCSLVLGELRVV